MDRIKNLFKGDWDENKQRTWAWGFIVGFFLANIGYGIGWLFVQVLPAN